MKTGRPVAGRTSVPKTGRSSADSTSPTLSATTPSEVRRHRKARQVRKRQRHDAEDQQMDEAHHIINKWRDPKTDKSMKQKDYMPTQPPLNALRTKWRDDDEKEQVAKKRALSTGKPLRPAAAQKQKAESSKPTALFIGKPWRPAAADQKQKAESSKPARPAPPEQATSEASKPADGLAPDWRGLPDSFYLGQLEMTEQGPSCPNALYVMNTLPHPAGGLEYIYKCASAETPRINCTYKTSVKGTFCCGCCGTRMLCLLEGIGLEACAGQSKHGLKCAKVLR